MTTEIIVFLKILLGTSAECTESARIYCALTCKWCHLFTYYFIMSLLFILPHYCAVVPQIYCAPTWRSWWQRVYCAALEGYSWEKCTAALSSSSWRGVLVWPLVRRSAAAGETVRIEWLWVVWPLWPWVLWGKLPRTVNSVELSSDDGRSLFY